MKNIILLSIVAAFGITACIQPPDYPVEPKIEFVSVSKSEVLQQVDTFRINFSYTDGDGDIGFAPNDTTNITIIDSRTGNEDTPFRVPIIPQQGVSNGISGEISLLVFASCCINSPPFCVPAPGANPEEIIYTIRMFDQAGNVSNTIQTSPIFLICD